MLAEPVLLAAASFPCLPEVACMIRLISLAFLGSLVVSFLVVNEIGPMSHLMPNQDERSRLWSQVQEDMDKGLPKSAIDKLKSIYDGAVEEQAYAEATRALCQRFIMEGQIDQPAYPYAIRQLQAALPEAPEAMRPVLRTILAEWFYVYYMQNQWRFQQRTQTSAPPGDDFETWDLARLLNEIDELFTEALANADILKTIPVAEYDAVLEKGNVSDAHRPTLYDFLAFEALRFYSLDEQFIRQQGAFRIRADSPVFADPDTFLNWSPETEDEDSYLLRAVRLFQDLLRFHADDDDRTAWLDADLQRLTFARSAAEGSEAGARYRAALQRYADLHVRHPLSASALAHLASSVQATGDLVQARRIAEQGQARFPDSVGGRMCHNLIVNIESKSVQVSTERVWHGSTATIDVQYRNIDKVWFRLIEFDYRNWTQWGQQRSPQSVYGDERERLVRRRAVAEWSVDLPRTEDYQQRSEAVPVDVDLKSGCYLLLCSATAGFNQPRTGFQSLSVAEVWISNLAVVMRRSTADNQVQAQVLDATTGQPIEGANVRKVTWKYDGRNSRETGPAQGTTDRDGLVSLPHEGNELAKLDISYDDQKFGLIDNLYSGRWARPVAQNATVFFTDRGIYRPGQPVRFKGICVRSDQAENDYQTLPDRPVTVTLYDANNQVVEKRDFRTNEFGSFSGTFTAPRDRVTGMMRLQASPVGGATTIRVEEYKRPKFFVEMDKPSEAFRLGQQVTIQGRATAYTGAAIDGSDVTWRVVRSVRYPAWYGWRYWYLPIRDNSQEIANGTAVTDAEGKFEIRFTAEPDESVSRDSEPVFNFLIYADVTDTAGETRSASQSTSVGYTSLEAALTASDWQTSDAPLPLKLKVTTLDGEGQEATGRLKVCRLVPPDQVQPARLGSRYRGPQAADDPDLSRINAWPLGETVYEEVLTTDASGDASTEVTLDAGAYRAVYETSDPAGQPVKAELPMIVHDPASDRFPVKIPNYFQMQNVTVEPGGEFVAVWGTGYDRGQAYVELEHRGQIIQAYWTAAGQTQHTLKFPIQEKHRGGVQLRITYVRENRLYSVNQSINVPWTSKQLSITWERFVSRLQPGGRETWTAVVKGPDAQRAVAEMVAALYDASLDAFVNHNWMSGFNLFYRNYSYLNLEFYNGLQNFNTIYQYQQSRHKDASVIYRYFVESIGVFGRGTWGMYWMEGKTAGLGGGAGGVRLARRGMVAEAETALSADMDMARPMAAQSKSLVERRRDAGNGDDGSAGSAEAPPVDLESVSPRKNLQETAFFFPHLEVAEDGTVRIEFEIPEALTEWKFLGFAHDRELKSALLTDKMTTYKDLMVQPNPPRFLREGDVLEFSVKVSNQSDDPQTGSVRLNLADARNGQNVDAAFGNQSSDQTFEIPPRQSTSLFWRIEVPDFVGVLTYRVVGATGSVSDGEEGFLPVLSRRILVTESLPLPIRGNQTKTFDFARLQLAGQSDTLQSQTLTVQMTSNPAWYAVMALPYLMEYPHQCSEQVFNRLYANSLGRHIVSSDPKIARIFEQWRGTDALDSPLEKNQDLRNVLIAESPWLLAGKKESQARRDVGILFDTNRLNAETAKALATLAEMQLSDGAWPWFPGGPANDYITLYVTTGFGRLRHLGVEVDVSPALRAIDRLDWWLNQRYQELKRRELLDRNNLSPVICLYFYGRSFFQRDKPVDAQYKTAFDYFLGQAREHWVKLGNRQSQGHLAIGLKRLGDRATPEAIMRSLTERSLQDEEMGMFWREGDLSWWWYKAPIETQALMIEAYDEVAGDADKVEELKIWLLKQKQTQNWKSTKATADACYGLLLRGTDLLVSDELVQVSLGGVEIRPEDVEAGTGFYEQRFVRGEIKPEMGRIEVVKSDAGIAWGSVHWQYLEDVGKIEPYEGTPLTLKKALYIRRNTERGPVITEVSGPVNVGDELVMRIELRVDRAMEYVHLKDYRGSGTEPVNVLSRYKFQDGLAYYESTRDTASHFFIDYLPRGTYVFEYPVRVQHRGVYETGIAELQCMYAPEFNSHSGSVPITVE
jgi:hypothetical protein